MENGKQQMHHEMAAGGEDTTQMMGGGGGAAAVWGPVGPGGVRVRLRVRAQVDFGLGMFVVGSFPQLGSWRSGRAVPMTKVLWQGNDSWSDDDSWSVWECQASLPKNSTVDYRYFVGKLMNRVSSSGQSQDTELDLEVIQWETNIQPRHLKTAGSDVDEIQVPLAEFGSYDGTHMTSTGWLVSHACIQVRLHSSAIFMLKPKHRLQRYSVKCSPIDYEPGLPTDDDRVNEESAEIFTEESSMDGPPTCTKTLVLYYNLNGNVSREVTADDLRPKPQPSKGCMYNPDDYLVFLARGVNQNHLGFQLDFMVNTHRAQPRFVGSAHLLPPKKGMSVVTKRVPIIGLHNRPIGEVQVEVLRVVPLPNYDSLMDVSYQNHWKWRTQGTTLNVGHRGMGSSYKRVTSAKENTICSLHTAATHGADFVELDVLLSKDKVPVIYHDFDVCLFAPNKSKYGEGGRLVQIAIKDLTVEQLHSMKIYHSDSSTDPIEITERKDDDHEDDSDEQPFPSLQSCLEKVDPNVGFNIEIKFPQIMESGESEQENFFDLNCFLDTILKVVLKHAGERKIIFSCFHADICIMVGLKQNKYPVLLLCQGQTERYQPYKDWRAKSFQNGINFAKAEGILGVDLHAEGVLKDLTLVPYIQSLGLVVFVWGEDLNEDHVKNTLRGLNVDAIIFDRIGQNQTEQFTICKQTPSLEEMMSNAPTVSTVSTSCTSFRRFSESASSQHNMPSYGQSANNNHFSNVDSDQHSTTMPGNSGLSAIANGGQTFTDIDSPMGSAV